MIRRILTCGRPALVFAGLLAAVPLSSAQADVYMQVGGAAQSAPAIALAVPPFIAGAPYDADSAKAARTIEGVVVDDLLFSRYFKIMQDGAHWTGSNLTAAVSDWQTRGAAWLLTAQASAVKSEISVMVQLINTQSGNVEFSRVYRQEAAYKRSLAHKISDDVVHDLTGKKGIAESEIAFSNDSTGHKEIYLMDYDGANLRRMTWDHSICLLPRFSPDKSLLVFTSYRDGNPDLFGINLATGRREVVSNAQGLNVAGGFSPDGAKLLLTMSRERTPSIYLKNLTDDSLTRLTENFGTDSSPTFSPDGAQVAFVSDVSGNPEIYLMDTTTLSATRITSLAWCDSPAWSPTGAWIAFAGRANARDSLDIFLVDVTGTHIRRLTNGEGANEDPRWSADGRFIVFSSTRNGRSQIFMMDADGSAPHVVADIPGNSITPAWSN